MVRMSAIPAGTVSASGAGQRVAEGADQGELLDPLQQRRVGLAERALERGVRHARRRSGRPGDVCQAIGGSADSQTRGLACLTAVGEVAITAPERSGQL